MLTSAELRWFKQGALPEEVYQWFQEDELGEAIESPQERKDVYLYLPECAYLGIKLRQGRLEIKWRNAEIGKMRWQERVEGKAEIWGKWLCEDPTTESFQPAVVSGQKAWVSVKKMRSQRQYQLLADGSIKSVSLNTEIDQGCNLEITQLDINSNIWWSLAFEAFGNGDRLTEILSSVASWVLDSYPRADLQVNQSFAYPTWLSLVA